MQQKEVHDLLFEWYVHSGNKRSWKTTISTKELKRWFIRTHHVPRKNYWRGKMWTVEDILLYKNQQVKLQFEVLEIKRLRHCNKAQECLTHIEKFYANYSRETSFDVRLAEVAMNTYVSINECLELHPHIHRKCIGVHVWIYN